MKFVRISVYVQNGEGMSQKGEGTGVWVCDIEDVSMLSINVGNFSPKPNGRSSTSLSVLHNSLLSLSNIVTT